jgi:hypothetical protein
VRLRDIVSGWPLGVTILAVVKTILGTSWNAERRTKAIALYISAAAKWARIKFYVTHISGSAMFLSSPPPVQRRPIPRHPAHRHDSYQPRKTTFPGTGTIRQLFLFAAPRYFISTADFYVMNRSFRSVQCRVNVP